MPKSETTLRGCYPAPKTGFRGEVCSWMRRLQADARRLDSQRGFAGKAIAMPTYRHREVFHACKRMSIDRRSWAPESIRPAAGAMRARFAMGGVAVILVEIDPDELAAWAQATGRVVDAEARLDFAGVRGGLKRVGRRKIRVTVRHRSGRSGSMLPARTPCRTGSKPRPEPTGFCRVDD
jgi:hypothetical protein